MEERVLIVPLHLGGAGGGGWEWKSGRMEDEKEKAEEKKDWKRKIEDGRGWKVQEDG